MPKTQYEKDMLEKQAKHRKLQAKLEQMANNESRITRDLDSYLPAVEFTTVPSKKKSNNDEVLGGKNLLINKQKNNRL